MIIVYLLIDFEFDCFFFEIEFIFVLFFKVPKKILLRYCGAVLVGWTLLILILYLSYDNGQSFIGEKFKKKTMPEVEEIASHRQPHVDGYPDQSVDTLVKDINKNLPNLPTIYWMKMKRMRVNKTCANIPSVYDLKFDSIYWQTLSSSNGTFHFFNAYFDNRPNDWNTSSIRILAMIDRIEATVSTYCQMWFFDRQTPLIVEAVYNFIWNIKWGGVKQGIFYSYLITCPLPEDNENVPDAVSIVEKPCDTATNNLRVIYNVPKERKKIAVCVKGLDFYREDLSVKLVEWLELLFLLGVDKVFLYQLQVHPNISKVLKYYEEKGKVDVTQLTLPGGQPNAPIFQHIYLKNRGNLKRRNEILPYNDCLYKNLYSYEYVVLLDTDEIIIPVKDPDWISLITRIKSEQDKKDKYASFNVRNVYFLDDLLHNHGWFEKIPTYMHMLQHVYRVKNFTKPLHYVKCFHDVQKVLTLHNHLPLDCLGHRCSSLSIKTDDAQLQHYRTDCVGDLRNMCEKYKEDVVLDTAIWRYEKGLISRAFKALSEMGFFN